MRFKPSKDAIKLAALTSQLAACKAANTAVKVPLIAYNDAVSDRSALFKPLNKLTTRLYAIFKGTDALKQESEPTYAPAENELQVAILQAMFTDMGKKNNAADLAYQTLKGVRTTRNTALYAYGTGREGLPERGFFTKYPLEDPPTSTSGGPQWG